MKRLIGPAAATIVLGGIAPLVFAQVFEISRSTIDGGGVMRSADLGGSGFELSGTIGPPDAGTMSGGSFQLTGGFWFEIPPTDCNEDGAVTLLDSGSLVLCLNGPDGGAQPDCACFDVDNTGAVDLRDFAAAQIAFSGP